MRAGRGHAPKPPWRTTGAARSLAAGGPSRAAGARCVPGVGAPRSHPCAAAPRRRGACALESPFAGAVVTCGPAPHSKTRAASQARPSALAAQARCRRLPTRPRPHPAPPPLRHTCSTKPPRPWLWRRRPRPARRGGRRRPQLQCRVSAMFADGDGAGAGSAADVADAAAAAQRPALPAPTPKRPRRGPSPQAYGASRKTIMQRCLRELRVGRSGSWFFGCVRVRVADDIDMGV